MTQSEITRLLTRIEQEYASARSGLSGLASGTARHAFIDACPRVGGVIPQDAHKGRPYYGRVIDVWEHFPRTLTSEWSASLVAGRGWPPRALIRPIQAYPRRMDASHVQIPPIPVHSRDTACVRPVGLRTQRTGALPAWASCELTHPTHGYAPGLGVLRAYAPNARVRLPACASCRIAHPTHGYACQPGRPAGHAPHVQACFLACAVLWVAHPTCEYASAGLRPGRTYMYR